MNEQQDQSSVQLIMTEDIRELMRHRGVSESYVMQVIAEAERTSVKLVNMDNGRFIGHRRIGKITCWVDYQKVEDAYRVHNAYMHRMEIEGEE